MKKATQIILCSVCVVGMVVGCVLFANEIYKQAEKQNENGWHAVIRDYDYAYQTSQVQEITHDIRLAICDNETYIAIDRNYNKSYVPLKYTGNYIYYWVYKVSDQKVSNKGWELL